MKNSKYFQQAIERVNENDFLHFDDQFNADFENADDFETQQEMLNATGKVAAQVSQPYIITIQNTTTTAISNAELLNAYGKHDSFAVSGASITYGISGVTYRNFLYQTMNNPFTCGLLRLECSNTSQVQSVITITTKDANGNRVDRPFIPSYDRYQNITTVTDIEYTFIVDGFTALTIATLYGSATLTLKLYPAIKAKPINTLTGTNFNQGYRSPNLNPLVGGSKAALGR